MHNIQEQFKVIEDMYNFWRNRKKLNLTFEGFICFASTQIQLIWQLPR